jgi:hypothetical protein
VVERQVLSLRDAGQGLSSCTVSPSTVSGNCLTKRREGEGREQCDGSACASRAARDRVMQSGGEPRLCILSVLCSQGRGEENA